ncbi:hypothetical protein H4R18_002994 [Coemansia javaensis]|uniref:Nudix hydrolase domain-containing protein n=1 Tax=Coemansia javaensis TaxID=2761396 RepID=A0A9W8HD86_9FUNG|nr:hypothetical protein H4R18_002994 [Coemansia javaensis]
MFYPRAKTVISAGAVVFDAGCERVLTIVNLADSPSTTSFPKGRIEPGEHIEEAARRETEEETGVVCRLWPDGFVGAQTRHYSDTDREKFVFWYAATAVDTRAQRLESHEQLEARWLGIAEALAQLSFEDDRGLLAACLELRDRRRVLAAANDDKPVFTIG